MEISFPCFQVLFTLAFWSNVCGIDEKIQIRITTVCPKESIQICGDSEYSVNQSKICFEACLDS